MGAMRNTPSTSPVLPAELVARFEPAELEAGLLAAALPCLTEWGLDLPPLDDVFDALGVTRARAVEVEAAMLELLPTALPRPDERLLSLTRMVVDYLKAHPGAVRIGPRRRSYSRCFRRFVLDLRERHDELEIGAFADAVGVSQRTLAGWLRRARR